MNILTFDIEEWYIEKIYNGDRKAKYHEYDLVLERILNLLDETNKKATFFCLGELARYFPLVVKKIAQKGHEIGCHSNQHDWLTKLNKFDVAEDTRIAIDVLEQCTGSKVISYRAPAFSICESNKWVFEILRDCGIQRDASIFPAARDFGGFTSFNQKVPCFVQTNGIQLKEFPISTFTILRRDIAYSGGGYFRFFPFPFINYLLHHQSYVMSYFHIGDLLPETKSMMTRKEYEEYFKEYGSWLNRSKRYVKSNLGTKGAFVKLEKLIKNNVFVSLEDADKLIDWNNTPIVEL